MPLTLHLVPTQLHVYAESARIPAWQLLRREADRLQPELRTLWDTLFRAVRDHVDLPALEAALARGNVLEAEVLLRALWTQYVDAPARALLPTLLRDTVERAALAVTPHLAASIEVTLGPPLLAFNLPVSLEWLNTYVGTQIQGISQRSLLALRSLMREGFAAGTPLHQLAEQIAAAIGLTRQQTHQLARLRARMVEVGATRTQIARAIRDATQRGLALRGESIARTESMWAANAGQQERWQQAINQGSLDVDAWQRQWLTAHDERTCPLCRPMDGQRREMGEPFQAAGGATLLFPPLHPMCRCTLTLVPREES